MTTARDRLAVGLLFLLALSAPLSNGVANVTAGVAMAVALLLALLGRGRAVGPPRLLVILMAVYLVWNTLATATAAPAPVRWDKLLEELWHKPLMLAIPVLAWAVPRQVARAVQVMVVVGAVVGLYAVFQHFTGQDLVRGGTTTSEGGRYLAVGFFDHHLTYGGQVMMLLVMAGAWLLLRPDWRSVRAGGVLVAAGLLAVALLSSFARSAQLGALVGALVIVAHQPPGRRPWSLAAFGAAIATALSIPAFRQRAAQILEAGSESTRLNLWESSLAGIAARPWLGWGRGNFGSLMARHEVPGAYEARGHSHNDLLMQAVNSGVVGLLLYVALLGATGVIIWRRRHRLAALSWVPIGVVAMLIGLSLAGLFQVYQTDDEVETVFYFLLGCALALGVAPAGTGEATAGEPTPDSRRDA